MDNSKTIPLLLAVAVGLFVFRSTAYKVSEWEQAIVTEFGNPVGEPVVKAGLHFTLPWREVRRLDRRILNWDGYPNQIPTKDKKYIWVDTTARWRIENPLLFIQSVRDEDGARSRIDGVLDSVTRDVISNNNLVEAVRNTKSAEVDSAPAEKPKVEDVRSTKADDEDIDRKLEKIEFGREVLSERIIDKARDGLAEFGIEIIDVQLRRIAYEKSVESKVFERMISERLRVAEKIRSEGQGERAKITGEIQRDLLEIQSDAYRKAEILRGKADAEAIRIYAGAMNADPKFYEFLRTLEAYKKALPKDTKFILSTDNKFLNILRNKE